MTAVRWIDEPTETELATAADVCVSALFDDPVQKAFFRGCEALARAFLTTRLRSGLVAIGAGGVGVAAWHAHASGSDLEAVKAAAKRFDEGPGMLACFEDVRRRSPCHR